MAESPVELKKTISWVQGAAMTIGAVLGSGVLVLPVAAAELAGPASLVAWLLMGLLAIPLVMTLGTLGAAYPDAGGIAAFARRAFGPRAEAVTGWLFLGTVPIGGPIVALIGANYAGRLFGATPWQVGLVAAGMLSAGLFFNYLGISLSGRVQIGVVATISLILLAAVLTALPRVRPDSFTPFAPHGWVPVGVAMTLLFWAFVGWEMIVHLGEEFRDPQRDIPRSLAFSLGIIIVLYLSLAVATVGTASYRGAANITALAGMVGQGVGHWAGDVTALLGFLVCYGTIHTYLAGFSRLIYAQAREGHFPSFFARLHPRYQTPHRTLLVLGPVFFLVLLLAYYRQFDLSALIKWPSAVFIALYVIGMASGVKLLAGKGRYYAMVSLAACLIVYGFLGWAGLYPIGLGVVGWLTTQKRWPVQARGRDRRETV
ncbi:MAG TPA: amino acid permease [Spirochaetia bacterium]|nr:amino acid permease [Spirochaetia bacterium]